METPWPSQDALLGAVNRTPTAGRIYLDYNATAPLREEAYAAMRPYLLEEFGNAASLHHYGQRTKAALERARRTCAEVLGCAPEELVFTSGGTESDNLALRGAAGADPARGRRRAEKRRIVASAIEHPAVRETVRALSRQGFRPVWVAPRRDGRVEAARFVEALSAGEAPAVAALMYANNESGVVQPVAEVGRACRERGKGTVFHVDAVQAPGKLPLKVEALCCDTLALSAHKFEGPKGVGLLYVRHGTKLAAQMSGGHHEGALRGGTPNVAGIVGLAEALRLAEAEREAETARLARLQKFFENTLLAQWPGVVIHGRASDVPPVSGVPAVPPRLPNTSFVSFRGLDGEAVVRALDLEGIAVSTGSACSEGISGPSLVLEAMRVEPNLRRGAVRFSFGRGTRKAPLRAALERLVPVIERLRAGKGQAAR